MKKLEIILYQPIHKKVAGNLPGGLILSYLIRKLSSVPECYITLTNKQISQDTLLNIDQVIKAKKRLNKLPFLKIELVKNKKVSKNYQNKVTNSLNIMGVITQYSIDWNMYTKYMKALENE